MSNPETPARFCLNRSDFAPNWFYPWYLYATCTCTIPVRVYSCSCHVSRISRRLPYVNCWNLGPKFVIIGFLMLFRGLLIIIIIDYWLLLFLIIDYHYFWLGLGGTGLKYDRILAGGGGEGLRYDFSKFRKTESLVFSASQTCQVY